METSKNPPIPAATPSLPLHLHPSSLGSLKVNSEAEPPEYLYYTPSPKPRRTPRSRPRYNYAASFLRKSLPRGRNPFMNIDAKDTDVPKARNLELELCYGTTEAMRSMNLCGYGNGNVLKVQDQASKSKVFRSQTISAGQTQRTRKSNRPRITVVHEFKFRTAERGAVYQKAFQQKIKDEEHQRRLTASFRARPVTVLYREPYRPGPSLKPLTVDESFYFETEIRAKERQLFDEQMKQKQEEQELYHKQEAERNALEEKAKILELRKRQFRKAQPVPNFSRFQVSSSNKPLTRPISPNFHPLSRRRFSRVISTDDELNSRPGQGDHTTRRRSSSVGG